MYKDTIFYKPTIIKLSFKLVEVVNKFIIKVLIKWNETETDNLIK